MSAGITTLHERPHAVVRRSDDDCVVAALATALGWAYEQAAGVLGFSCHPTRGNALIPHREGLELRQLPGPLFGVGIATSHLIARESPDLRENPYVRSAFYPSVRIAEMIRGHRAVVGTIHYVATPQGPAGERHAVAWDGEKIVDDGSVMGNAEQSPFWEALVLTPLSALRGSS